MTLTPLDRRLLLALAGVAGVAVAAFALHSNYTAVRMYCEGGDFLHYVFADAPYPSVFAFSLASLSFYTLTVAVFGGRFLTRRWLPYSLAAVILSAALVVVRVVLVGYVIPPPETVFLRHRPYPAK